MATLEQKQAITALYVGYFDRAPDPAGLQFWIEQIDNGREFNTIAADFAASDEAEALYPYLTTPDVSSPALFVENIYANLFGRTADDEGRDFWVDALESGSVSVGDMIAAIIDGARDDEEAGTFDKSILDNKVEVGLDFATEAGNTPGFEFDAAAKAAAVAAVNGVTEDEATVEAAKEATDAFVSGDSNPGTGDNLTLTEDIGEEVVGAAGNDSFNAIIGDVVGTDADDTTLNVFDSVDGGAGRDTLNILVDGDVEVSSSTTIENVEVVNMFRTGETSAAVNASAFGAAAEELWQINNAGDIKGLADGQAAGFRAGTGAFTSNVTYVAAATAATVALDGVQANTRINVEGAGIETINLAGSVTDGNDENNADGYDVIVLGGQEENSPEGSLEDLTAINANFSTNVELQLFTEAAKTVETLDGSSSTGGLKVDLSGDDVTANYLAVETINTGSGNDTALLQSGDFSADDLAVSLGAGKDTLNLTMDGDINITVDMGAGNDKVTLGATTDNSGSLELTLGAGADRLTLETLANVADADDLEASLITVTDFNADEDVLVTGEGYDELDNTQAISVGEAASLEAALDLAASYNEGDYTVFDYAGDAYVYVENGSDNEFAAEDGLVKLVGVSVDDLDSTAFSAAASMGIPQ